MTHFCRLKMHLAYFSINSLMFKILANFANINWRRKCIYLNGFQNNNSYYLGSLLCVRHYAKLPYICYLHVFVFPLFTESHPQHLKLRICSFSSRNYIIH